jgi:glucose/arabinose dehydrogenase
LWRNSTARGIFGANEETAVKRLALGLLAGVAMFSACLAVLPGGFAVNLPLRSLFGGAGAAPDDEFRRRIRVPDGFEIGVFASDVTGARALHVTDLGDLLVSTPGSGEVHRLDRDSDGDGRSDGHAVLLDGLNKPYGLELRDGWLYVAETDRIVRIRLDATQRVTQGELETFIPDIPGGGGHWTRTLRFGPDGWLYVSIGSTCNVCLEDDPRRAAIVRYQADGSGEQIYATGLRNSVGFDWHPTTGELYANDNGRDLLGDDEPPEELNHVVEGGFYGWPFANGDNVPDPDLGAGHAAEIATAIPPVLDYPAHNAPLGLTFLESVNLPLAYRGAAITALHGSWNRSQKDGYKVVTVHFGPDGRLEWRDFVTGFLEDGDVIGRPVDIAEGPDGAIYVSDDYASSIYRIAYAQPRRSLAAATAAR